MSYKEVASLDCDTTITLGGTDKKTKKANPKLIEGYFLGSKETGPNKFNPKVMDVVHVFQTAKGNVGVWGKSDLTRKMKGVTLGAMVRATFTGTVPTNKGQDMLKFKVEIDEDNTIDVSALAGADTLTQTDEEYTDESVEENEEVNEDYSSQLSAAASTAAERKAKVEALLNRNKKN